MKKPALIHLAEECNELAQAILKKHRGDGDQEALNDEATDVQALLDVLVLMGGIKINKGRYEAKQTKFRKKYAEA
ncbi:hypothetical protein PQR71_29135 [Paraburkholderia fungorum]|uniref:hypothetical protein n=1 Tax=Paraburkholderia fungorum TaxID=134537 RepID=UPI0038B73C73